MLTAAYFTDRPLRMGDPADEASAQRNYDLCRAVDLLKLGVVLQQLVAAGMSQRQADCFYAQADALLQLMRTENNRLRAVPETPTPADAGSASRLAALKPTGADDGPGRKNPHPPTAGEG